LNLLRKSLVLLFLAFLVFPGFSQEEPDSAPPPEAPLYTLGDQTFSFNVGLFFPLFFSDTSWNFTSASENLSLGGVGSLEWNSYINSKMLLGAQLSGMFSITPNSRTLSMVPVCAKFSYILDFFPVTVPLTLAAGFSFNKLDTLFEFTPIVKPGASVLWYLNNEWSLGLNLNYWWVPEIHFGDLADQTRFGSFLEASFAAVYHF